MVGVLQGWFAADRWPVTRLTVQAAFHHVKAEQIRAAVLPTVRNGFFALDLDQVRQAVAALPWVEAVEARKQWPGTLVLRIDEYRPWARWNGNALISRQGKLFKIPGPVPMHLPELCGPDARLRDVIQFYAALTQTLHATQLKIAALALSKRGSWSLVTDEGERIVMGNELQARARLQRLLSVYPKLMRGHRTGFSYADLRYTNGFAVRWKPSQDVSRAINSAGGASRT
jgi:cell division protein FtsQ